VLRRWESVGFPSEWEGRGLPEGRQAPPKLRRRDGKLNGAHTQWELQTQISLGDSNATTLSWGPDEELLVGSHSLTLWATATNHGDTADVRLLWRRELANPAKLAVFSADASLVATVADHDRLVKIWWKLSIGAEDNQFDFAYLPHPRAVEWLQWRQPLHPEETADSVLYTITSDQVLRVWAPVYPHDVHVLQLWAVVDLRESIPRGLGEPAEDTYPALIIDSKVFRLGAEQAVATAGTGDKERETLQRLVEVANRSPEVVVVFDSRGRMSAWGLENVACKSRKTTNMFSIVHAENSGVECGGGREVRFSAFAGGEGLTVLAHDFEGRISWLEARLDALLDPLPTGPRFKVKGIWMGHDAAVESIVRTADGRSLLSSTRENKHLVWTASQTGDSTMLLTDSVLEPVDKVERAAILENGDFIMTLHADYVALWDTRSSFSTEVARCDFSSKAKMLSLILLPEISVDPPTYHVVAVDEEMTGIAWQVTLPVRSSKTNGINGNTTAPYLKELAKFDLGPRDGVLAIIPVDPVGWSAVLSDSLDMFCREVATTISKSGLLRSWTVKVYSKRKDAALKWLATSSVETGIKNVSLSKGNSIRKIALVDEARTELTIWDSRAAQLEFSKVSTKGDEIRDLDFTSTPQSQSILAVGFQHRVVLVSQLRYDYLNAGPAWAPFREIDISGLTPHPIGDSIWLQDGGLVIGCGNQLLLYPRKIQGEDKMLDSLHLTSHTKKKMDDIFDIVSELNGPLPVYHPQFLQQSILAGKSKLVELILVKLYKELRNYHEEIGLDPFLDLPIDTYISRDQVCCAIPPLFFVFIISHSATLRSWNISPYPRPRQLPE
jgi:WD40 repeat protein